MTLKINNAKTDKYVEQIYRVHTRETQATVHLRNNSTQAGEQGSKKHGMS